MKNPCPEENYYIDFTQIMLADLLNSVSFSGNVFIRKCDNSKEVL